MMPGPQACRECGCTQDRACVTDGVACHWVQPDLCSACADQPTADEVKKAALFFDILQDARNAGKGWWASSQYRQIELSIEQDRKIVVLRTALLAASNALRSYQYGNGATDLAKSIADSCDAALKAAMAP
ncbi:hypothetical protein C8D77_101262 [Mesorhizobium loti]|uniref:Uncharacterized protein n=1 Tax=Rhizobium loti TaxID=381 RepID=A0A8E2WFP4_RHILI|nr:hypothetical protein [Mesorhizobium loti]PWJ93583.1 hypothetical protein C8D77_101262 [Mesorhizobium loti]